MRNGDSRENIPIKFDNLLQRGGRNRPKRRLRWRNRAKFPSLSRNEKKMIRKEGDKGPGGQIVGRGGSS